MQVHTFKMFSHGGESHYEEYYAKPEADLHIATIYKLAEEAIAVRYSKDGYRGKYCKMVASRIVSEIKAKVEGMIQRPCQKCGKEIGNDVFTVCDPCWDKAKVEGGQ